MIFFEGILAGLPLALLIGPVLFTLLQGSLRHGWRGGMAVAIGISISDVVAVGLLLGVARNWLLREDVQWWLGIMSAILLAGLGRLASAGKEPTWPGRPTERGYVPFGKASPPFRRRVSPRTLVAAPGDYAGRPVVRSTETGRSGAG